jgi:hypothetical protein
VAGQTASLDNLFEFASLPYAKFENVTAKKGFKRFSQEDRSGVIYKKFIATKTKSKEQTNPAVLSYCTQENEHFISYETTDINEFQNLTNELKKTFHYPKQKDNSFPLFFQRGNQTVELNRYLQDSVEVYQFNVTEKDLPKPRDITYAEELLQFSSHEYLIATFGESNVIKDIFYFSEKELNKCSILFPNTNREVIFVWSDETNYKDVSFLVIGGHIQTQKTMDFNQQVEQNAWRSNQGIYTGMSLNELQTLNGQEVKFYGWQLEYAGAITPRSKGKINFDRIGCILNCLNCNGYPSYQTKIVNSEEALADNKKIFVTTMIILPERNNKDHANKM